MRRFLIAGFALLSPISGFAQFAEPEIQVQMLSDKDYSAVAEDEAAIMSSDEFYKLRGKAFSFEDVAAIRVAFKGRWYKSADYLAREKAAALGANALVLVEATGREELGAGAVRSYRALRLANSAGRPIYTKPSDDPPPAAPAPPDASPAEAAAPSTAPEAPPAPRSHRHFDWVWVRDASVLSHRLGFDTARASKDELEQLKLYVQENFPAAEYRKLLKAYDTRSKVMLDFVKGTIE